MTPIEEAQVMPEQESAALAVHVGLGGEQVTVFEAESLQLESESNSITVTDQLTYERMVEVGRRIQDCSKRWASWIQRPYDVVYGTYKRVLELKKAVQDPLDRGKRRAADEVLRFDREQEELRLAEEARRREEQERQEQERKLATASEAEAQGASEEVVQQILQQPSTAPTPSVSRTYTRAAGASTRANWVCEITDAAELVRFCALKKNAHFLEALELQRLILDHPTLNRLAKTHEAALGTIIPGVRGVNKGAASFRR